MNKEFEVCFFLLVILRSHCAEASSSGCDEPDCSKVKYNYDRESCLGPVNWSDITPCWSQCGGNRQSPVNIRRADATFSNIGSFTFNIGVQQAFQVSTFSKGFATTFKIENANIILSNVNQFGLTGSSFKLDGFHFHTGRYNSMMGSEHSFDGKFTPLELHLVFYNTKYPDVNTASTQLDGLVVIGVMTQAPGRVWNSQFPDCQKTNQAELSRVLKKAFKKTEDYSEDEPFFADLALKDLLPSDQESFYTYEGSLTTPPCSESVTWIVMKCPIAVSVNVIENFKNIKIHNDEEELGVHGSRRPVQRGQQNTPFTLLDRKSVV